MKLRIALMTLSCALLCATAVAQEGTEEGTGDAGTVITLEQLCAHLTTFVDGGTYTLEECLNEAADLLGECSDPQVVMACLLEQTTENALEGCLDSLCEVGEGADGSVEPSTIDAVCAHLITFVDGGNYGEEECVDDVTGFLSECADPEAGIACLLEQTTEEGLDTCEDLCEQ